MRSDTRFASRAMTIALAAGLSLVPALGLADLADVRSCVEANAPRISIVQEITLSLEEEGRERLRARFTLYWRRLPDGERRILLRFVEPEDLAEAALLIHSTPGARPTVHLSLPGQSKPRRVSSRGDLEGFLGRANLGIEEMRLLLDPLGGANLRLIRDASSLDGRKAWLLEKLASPGSDDRFPRVRAFIDREFCIPLRAELYDGEEILRKSLEVAPENVARIDGRWIPRLLVFRDIARGSDTVLRVESAEVDLQISPALLSPKALSASRP